MSVFDEKAETDLNRVALYQRDYQLTFNSQWGKRVLVDLGLFCRAVETCVAIPHKRAPVDIYRTFILEGRREVFLKIQNNLNLPPEHLLQLIAGQPTPTGDDNGE